MRNAVRTLQFAQHDMQRFRVVGGKSRFKIGVAPAACLQAEGSQAYRIAPVLAPQVAKKAHRRGLAIGAGDGRNRDRTGGMEIGRHPRIESSNVRHSQDDDFRALVLVEAQSFVARAFRYRDGLCAFRSGLRAERKTIVFGARQGAEQVTVANVSGIVGNAEDEQIFRFGRSPAAVCRRRASPKDRLISCRVSFYTMIGGLPPFGVARYTHRPADSFPEKIIPNTRATMTDKPLPFDERAIREIARNYPTPFYIYDESAIRASARRLNQAFAWAAFKEYFAVKATPNPHLLKILRQENLGGDCSSLAELVLCERVGITGENIMFTSNETPAKEYRQAKELGAIINLDDITHIPYLEQHVGLPEVICLRYNPGPLREGNAIIGKPEEAKYGFTREQLFEGYRQLKAKGVRRFGLHTMVASNELNPEFFVETAKMLFDLAVELARDPGVRFEFVNLGGGIGIPYRPGEKAVDLDLVGRDPAGVPGDHRARRFASAEDLHGKRPLHHRSLWLPRHRGDTSQEHLQAIHRR